VRRPCTKESGAAPTKEIAVMQLVDGVLEVETTQQRVRRQLGRPQNVTSTIGFDFPECEQLAHAPVEIAPHPSVNRAEDPIERGDSREWRHGDLANEAASGSF
jgi:hypothetical protein